MTCETGTIEESLTKVRFWKTATKRRPADASCPVACAGSARDGQAYPAHRSVHRERQTTAVNKDHASGRLIP
jgi:hypothetical protein